MLSVKKTDILSESIPSNTDEFSEGHNQDFFQVEYFRALKVSQCCKRSAEVRTRNPASESINLFVIHEIM